MEAFEINRNSTVILQYSNTDSLETLTKAVKDIENRINCKVILIPDSVNITILNP